jgi:hypothetical protein
MSSFYCLAEMSVCFPAVIPCSSCLFQLDVGPAPSWTGTVWTGPGRRKGREAFLATEVVHLRGFGVTEFDESPVFAAVPLVLRASPNIGGLVAMECEVVRFDISSKSAHFEASMEVFPAHPSPLPLRAQ